MSNLELIFELAVFVGHLHAFMNVFIPQNCFRISDFEKTR